MLDKVGNRACSSPLERAVVVHMHLGMSGSFRTYKFPGTIPAVSARCLERHPLVFREANAVCTLLFILACTWSQCAKFLH